MKAKDILTKNKDLDLRRYGKYEYSSKSGEGSGSNLENVISKNWKVNEIMSIEEYNSMHIPDDVIAEKNIPEDSTAVALCSMEMGDLPSPKSVYIYGLTESEADLLNSANLEMDISEFPVDCCLEIEKSGDDEPTFSIVNVKDYEFNDTLDFSDENKIYVGCCQNTFFYPKPLLSRITVEKNEVDKDKTTVSAIKTTAKPKSEVAGYLSNYLKESVEKLYRTGSTLYLGTLTVNDTNIILGFSLSGYY